MASLRTERIALHGCRSGRGPATLGQRSIWTDIEYMMPDTSFYNSVVPVEIAPGIDMDRVLAGLRALVERHGALRSLFSVDADGELVQEMEAGGEVAVELCEAVSGQDDDLYGLATDLEARIKGYRFDHAAEWPIRVGVGVLDGVPLVVLLSVSHIATDFPGLRLLASELHAIVHGADVGPPPLQPLDFAEWERSPKGRRIQERSLRHWRRSLEAMPPKLLAETGGAAERPRYPTVWLRSRAVAMAAAALGARCGVGSSAVLLAATALLLGRAAGEPGVTMVLIAGNRGRPELRDYVGNLAQDVPAGIDLTGGDFAAVARSAWSSSVNAYRNARCDRAETTRLREDVAGERGTGLDLAYYFNDLRPVGRQESADGVPTAGQVRAALPGTTTGSRGGAERDNLTVFLNVADAGGEGVELTLRADSLRLGSPAMRDFLLRFEGLLVAAVEHGEDSASDHLLKLAEARV
ncbi:condensation domain-containing protein [Nocardiopsis sp. CNT312]|uniref:condensation domain-containing protein n=1 Tax=Nocardiopsis sp. CNT312 TaxID=1137268 RepID=UPI0004B9D244|nr:condensation domain-containing protein [Nocardiopsis sp. CNT312]